MRLERTLTIHRELFSELVVGEELQGAEDPFDDPSFVPVGSDNKTIAEVIEAATRMAVVIGWVDETHSDGSVVAFVGDPELPSSTGDTGNKTIEIHS